MVTMMTCTTLHGRYSQMSKLAEWPSMKWQILVVGSYTWRDGRLLKIEGLVKSRTLMGKVVIARRFSFIVAIYNYLSYQQYKTAASAPSGGVWMSLQNKELRES